LYKEYVKSNGVLLSDIYTEIKNKRKWGVSIL
jgi:hypothetical protein